VFRRQRDRENKGGLRASEEQQVDRSCVGRRQEDELKRAEMLEERKGAERRERGKLHLPVTDFNCRTQKRARGEEKREKTGRVLEKGAASETKRCGGRTGRAASGSMEHARSPGELKRS